MTQPIKTIKQSISSSQYMILLTSDKSQIPTNEKIKYGSYIRVLRRRRGLCC
jgi:hypothetical protein